MPFPKNTSSTTPLAISANFLEVEYNKDQGTSIVNVLTLSNSLGFTIKSVITTTVNNTTQTISINTDYLNKVYKDYSTGELVTDETLKFISVTDAELQMIRTYYNESRTATGLVITAGSKSKEYYNITLEEAFELVIYYYRNLSSASYSMTVLKDQLTSSDKTIQEIIASVNLEQALKPTLLTIVDGVANYTINAATDSTTPVSDGMSEYYSHNLIVYSGKTGFNTVEKLSNNYVNIKYTKGAGSSIATISTNVVTINSLING